MLPESDGIIVSRYDAFEIEDDSAPALDLSAYMSALDQAILDHGGDVGGLSFVNESGEEVVLLWNENDDIVTLDGRIVMHAPGGFNAAEVEAAYAGMMG